MAAASDKASSANFSESPYAHVALVSPHDTNELASVTRGISFKTAGTLKVLTYGGETVTFVSGALAVGIIHRLRVRQVFATDTTAGDIIAYW